MLRTQLLTAMIVMELVVALCMRSLKYSVFKVGVFKNKWLWIAILTLFALQLLILYMPGLQALFDVHIPEAVDWAIAALFGAIVFAAFENREICSFIEKKTMRQAQSFKTKLLDSVSLVR
jgi:magnesium-transporting ATPase (P-type)